jgi:hypothetical protein
MMAAADRPTCFYCDADVSAGVTVGAGPMRDRHGKTCCPDCWAASSLYDSIRSVTA